ncbi:type I-E CRISPR-associated protein Cse2/CasB [Streptomyces sp. ACA25]|uniref:type I-E CRISPR-associated protein Cse2/CasB n=1 Tax=Streptomyces sp. ACA25 TaxID=3022596 RepID=UPI00230760D6|nr:type I-E CRISPR-associated protein Cse2/CasB [Streptomyces sp. ACA25]MDB1087698.1 type I-E CRISPR-associated protein Cse2/CasB [Streptomyces sp. ACA25]
MTTTTGTATTRPAAPSGRHPRLDMVGTFVEEQILPLQRAYLSDLSSGVATLAQLRRGAGKPVEEVPELWGLTSDARLYSQAPAHHEGPWPPETAAHIALTLYALHQQSHRDVRMHVPGRELGNAVRRLMPPGDLDEPLRKRFVQAGSATNIDVLTSRLRAIVTLLRRAAIPLDYGLLADQLLLAQQPGGMSRVRRAWGRSFHAYQAKAAEGTEPSGTPASGGPANRTDATHTTTDGTTEKDAQ